MPSFSVLNDVAKELQAQFIASLGSAPDIGFTLSTDTLSLAPPSADLPAEVEAVLYLYQFEVDPHLRNQKLIADPANASQFIKPPLPLQLRFLFVPLTDSEETNQLMLGRILQHFHDNPAFQPLPGSKLATHRGGVPDMIRVRPDLLPAQELSQLWNGFSRPLRLSAGFLVDIVAVDSGAPSLEIPRVGESYGVTEKKPIGAAL